MTVNRFLEPYRQSIEAALVQSLQAPNEDVEDLYAMMRYHLGWVDRDLRPVNAETGKRLRPLLCLLACEAAGGDWHHALPASVALELVHNFSLIHDDIEDDSSTRRGRPAVWTAFGLAHGVNVGDSMLIMSRRALARLRAQGLDSDTILEALCILDTTCLRLCQGQYMDLAGEGRLEVGEDWYMNMIGRKTAGLLAASAQLGAIIAQNQKEARLYRRFGWNLGLAFQMVDDLLGIWGNPDVTGKPAACDIRERKMTLPVIFALRSKNTRAELADLYRQKRLSERDVSLVVDLLDRSGAQGYVQHRAASFEAAALHALEATAGRPPALERLSELTSSLTARQK